MVSGGAEGAMDDAVQVRPLGPINGTNGLGQRRRAHVAVWMHLVAHEPIVQATLAELSGSGGSPRCVVRRCRAIWTDVGEPLRRAVSLVCGGCPFARSGASPERDGHSEGGQHHGGRDAEDRFESDTKDAHASIFAATLDVSREAAVGPLAKKRKRGPLQRLAACAEDLQAAPKRDVSHESSGWQHTGAEEGEKDGQVLTSSAESFDRSARPGVASKRPKETQAEARREGSDAPVQLRKNASHLLRLANHDVKPALV
mmetsp:Transcript_108381/g.305624  ORF Transcript_108381/g.305624 Transcript_108381/m.305624 type:complete len:257 (+) Transcript_108381:847-1617(+)